MKRLLVRVPDAGAGGGGRLPIAQGRVVLRMATLVPDGSIWDRNLKIMASEWQKISAGRVAVTVFPSGQMGDEKEIVRRMRFENPQAAALTIVGLAEVDPAFNVFSMPFFFDSYDELYYVLDQMTPMLTQRLDQKKWCSSPGATAAGRRCSRPNQSRR